MLPPPLLTYKCERDGWSMLAEGFSADVPNFFLMSCFSRSRRQITEHLPASIFDHPFRHTQDRGELRRPRCSLSSRIGLYEKEK
jgi:hypothetical protein